MKKQPKPGSMYGFVNNGIISFVVVVTDIPAKSEDDFPGIVIWVNPKGECTHVVGQHDDDWAICERFIKFSKKKLAALFDFPHAIKVSSCMN